MPNEVNIRNKRASFDYEFLEGYMPASYLPVPVLEIQYPGRESQSGRFLLLF